MLNLLSGRSHDVLTGVCTLHELQCEVDVSRTVVQFSPLSSQEIEAYLKTGEPFDKAGAYAIQGFGSRFIEALFRAHNRMKRRGGRFALSGLQTYPEEVIRISRLDTIWPLFKTPAEAVRVLGSADAGDTIVA